MILTLVLSIITCVLLILSILFFPKIKIGKLSISSYWVITLIGALLIVITKGAPIQTIGESLTSSSSINPLKILVLFFSMTILSIYLDEVNFFKYIASKASALAKSNQMVLFVILYFLVSVLTVFTSNDIVILTFTPFICYFCKNSKIDPIPYLVSEFSAANTWSMMLIIGNPTNIYLATSFDINFISYLQVMWCPTLLAGLVELTIIYLLFRKKLKTPLNFTFEETKIDNIPNLIIGLIHLGTCLILLVISSYINLDMWLISLGCALSEIVIIFISNLIQKRKLTNMLNTFIRLPYELIPFVLSMFVIVSAISYQGISKEISSFFGENLVILKYGISSFLACNLINNIPMSVLFATFPNMVEPTNTLKAVYSTIIGSNIGAFLTPLGALAGIMFTSLLNKYEVKYSFKTFIKYGIIISLPTIAVALLSLLIVL